MARSPSAFSLATVCVAFMAMPGAALQSGPAAGPLRVHSTNPRYFVDGSGRAI